MYLTLYLMVATIGSVALLFAVGLYRLHNEIELFAGIALLCWTMLAIASGQVTVLTETGESVTQGSFLAQLLCVGLAAVSLFAIYGAFTGDWPPEQANDREGPI